MTDDDYVEVPASAELQTAARELAEATRLLIVEFNGSNAATTTEERGLRLRLARIYLDRVAARLRDFATGTERLEGLPESFKASFRQVFTANEAQLAQYRVQLEDAEKLFAASPGPIGKA